MTTTTSKSICQALVAAQKEFGPALKTSTNPHFKSRYADLASCIEAVIDALNNNGIYLMQPLHEDDNGVVIETLFIHESGETLSAGRIRVPAIKNDPQAYGSSTTYGRRYSLMAACGIAPEDDDGNAASKPRQAPSDKEINAKLEDCRKQVESVETVSAIKSAVDPYRQWAKTYGLGDMNAKIIEMAQLRAEALNNKE